MARILIVDDDPDIRTILADRLAARGHEIIEEADGLKAVETSARELPDLMLLDLDLPGTDGLVVLDRLRQEISSPTVVVITAFATIEKAVEAMRRGAFDFLPKPFQPGLVELTVHKALERNELREENRALRAAIPGGKPLIGASSALRELLDNARKAADSKSTVLLLGESGTGKEVLARSLHAWSPRASRPFIAVNCVALSEELLESELFGHEKGAFTGAHQQKLGKFELANHGTIFLDEVGDIRESLQVKLLRVLQEHEFERVGGTKPIRTDIRVIAATNRNLEDAVRSGRFREDLYYRLNVVRLRLPPLRDRRDDIPLLVEHFLRKYCAETGKTIPAISADAMDLLRQHDWPGNVRELENAIERAVVLGGGPQIRASDLAVLPGASRAAPDLPALDTPVGEFHEAVERFKRELIERALLATSGNQTRAAEMLGLQRTYLSRLIKHFKNREGADADADS
ncbi:MAG: sigma-54-dependent Fis family transcriptional regulator [Deltaproteobacteria bacterium]|nr:sigma-54-dependent Fis family transcriptional regulator [Deltaproteobacteria bacterium]